MASSFGEILDSAFARGGQLCVGIDPHELILKSWDLPDSAVGLEEFSQAVLSAVVAEDVTIIKPQVAFFERFGADGYKVLSSLTQRAKEANVGIIADAKRGDIGTTMDAYFEAWFGTQSGLYADALTVSPYLGLEAMESGFSKWVASGKGIFSLVATSNPEGRSVQLAQLNGTTLAAAQLAELSEFNCKLEGVDLGSYGAVIGATLDFSDFNIQLNASKTPVLAPGFGAQGAKLENARGIFQELSDQTIFSVSRSVLSSGSNNLRSAIRESKDALAQGLAR